MSHGISLRSPETPCLSPNRARHRLLLPVIGNSLHIVVCKRRRLFLLGFSAQPFADTIIRTINKKCCKYPCFQWVAVIFGKLREGAAMNDGIAGQASMRKASDAPGSEPGTEAFHCDECMLPFGPFSQRPRRLRSSRSVAEAQAWAISGCNLMPSACMTFRIVPKLGLPSPDSAL